ncbi:hypothetical protein ACWCPQ_14620 [Nocardia sp. NPDC001965]
MPALPRVQAIVLPILREAIPGVKIGSWVEDIDFRTFPMINVRRLGGARNKQHPKKLGYPVIEMTAYGNEDLPTTESLYDEALEALYDAVRTQKLTPDGYLHSINENMGATQFSSLFQDSWRVQGLIRLGIRSLNP